MVAIAWILVGIIIGLWIGFMLACSKHKHLHDDLKAAELTIHGLKARCGRLSKEVQHLVFLKAREDR